MINVDEIAQKRAELQQKQASENAHKEQLNAVHQNSIEVVGAMQGNAKAVDIQQIIQELRQIQLDTLMSAQQQSHAVSKPTVILTDQTDLGDRLTAVGDKISETISKLNSSEHDSQEIAQLKQFSKTLNDYITLQKTANGTSEKNIKALLTAIHSLKLSPSITVPEPKVMVTTQNIDLKPLQDTIKEYFVTEDAEDSLDLSCYRAQDINNNNPKLQYIGFMNPEGNWYIIENDMGRNTLRYVFGNDNYESSFKRAASYSYSLLNEAIHALST